MKIFELIRLTHETQVNVAYRNVLSNFRFEISYIVFIWLFNLCAADGRTTQNIRRNNVSIQISYW
jgi:hypothetical protein